MSRKKKWSYTAGCRPNTVRVYERDRPDGILYGSVFDPCLRDGRGGEVRQSLGHRDRDRAMAWAEQEAKKLREGRGRGAKPTTRRVFSLYLEHRTPDKGARQRREDGRAEKRWRFHLGEDLDLSRLSRREWDSFIRDRRSGRLASDGTRESKGRTVGDRVVHKDLVWLRSVCRWAREFRPEARGPFLLEDDPTRGFPFPREKNPNRPVATHDRVDAIRERYQEPMMRIELGGRREIVESYLPEIFEVVVGTGRRITAICSLRAEDLELEPSADAPYGAIVWPQDTDKMKKRWSCPVSPTVRQALEAALRKRRAVGAGYLFPKPSNPQEPAAYRQVTEWLRKAESLAELEPQKGGAWHPYRRLWATSRKDLPDVDVAQAGGWSSLEALKMAYQRPDAATMLRVVTHAAELREVRR